MFRSMRFLLIALMFVLLPLRGWAGDIMAVNMAVSLVQTHVDSNASQASMPPDCAMHAQLSTDDAATAFCSNCETCELCLAVANLMPEIWQSSYPAPPSSPLASGASFNSATSASNLKPPIS